MKMMTSQPTKRNQSHHVYNPSDIEVIEILAREYGNPLLARGAFGQISIALSVPNRDNGTDDKSNLTKSAQPPPHQRRHRRRRREDVQFVAIKSIRNAFTLIRNLDQEQIIGQQQQQDVSLSYLSNSFGFAPTSSGGLQQPSTPPISLPQESSSRKNDCDYEFTQPVLAELSALRDLPPHTNIISLLSSYAPTHDPYSLHLVFPYCPMGDLSHLILKRRFARNLSKSGAFSLSLIRSITKQILQGIRHCHDHGIIHCDIKPANILLHSSGNFQLTDFGLAKKYTASTTSHQHKKPPPSEDHATLTISATSSSMPYHLQSRQVPAQQQQKQPHGLCTLHYRAPEHLFGSHDYTPACDQWSMGLILTELLTLRPTFPGRNVLDQLRLVVEGLGPPNTCLEEWPEVKMLPDYHKVSYTTNNNENTSRISRTPSQVLARLIPRLGDEESLLRNMVMSLLNWNPKKRSSAKACLDHAYFTNEFILQPWQIVKEFQWTKNSDQVSGSFEGIQKTDTERNEEIVRSCTSWLENIEQKKLEGAVIARDMRLQMEKEGDPLHNSPGLRGESKDTLSSYTNSKYKELAKEFYQK